MTYIANRRCLRAALLEEATVTECRICDKVLRSEPDAIEDTVLYSNSHFVCIPALGALVPGYVILAR